MQKKNVVRINTYICKSKICADLLLRVVPKKHFSCMILYEWKEIFLGGFVFETIPFTAHCCACVYCYDIVAKEYGDMIFVCSFLQRPYYI